MTLQNYGEVLSLIKRRRRVARSLSELSEFLVSLPHASVEGRASATRKVVGALAGRYGSVVEEDSTHIPTSDQLYSLVISDELILTVSQLPLADDELREVSACLQAIRAALTLSAGTAVASSREVVD